MYYFSRAILDSRMFCWFASVFIVRGYSRSSLIVALKKHPQKKSWSELLCSCRRRPRLLHINGSVTKAFSSLLHVYDRLFEENCTSIPVYQHIQDFWYRMRYTRRMAQTNPSTWPGICQLSFIPFCVIRAMFLFLMNLFSWKLLAVMYFLLKFKQM